MSGDPGKGWAGYYAWSSGRAPRPLLLAACALLGAGDGRVAVDLGCGAGIDALALLARGWSVVAMDSDPAGLDLLRLRVPPESAERVRTVCASFADAGIPRAHLIHAGFSLPFCDPSQFPTLWARIRAVLRPGGIFAGQLFGLNDSWSTNPSMTFHDSCDVQDLLKVWEILELREIDRDGEAFSGPKHWHLFEILARAA